MREKTVLTTGGIPTNAPFQPPFSRIAPVPNSCSWQWRTCQTSQAQVDSFEVRRYKMDGGGATVPGSGVLSSASASPAPNKGLRMPEAGGRRLRVGFFFFSSFLFLTPFILALLFLLPYQARTARQGCPESVRGFANLGGPFAFRPCQRRSMIPSSNIMDEYPQFQ